MPTRRFASTNLDIDELYQELAERDLQPLWELPGLLTAQPRSRSVPFVWRSRDLTKLAARSGDLVGVERGGDRRVLACANPGLAGEPFAVGTLWAAVQFLAVGESAPAHRHTPSAIRFVISGSGVRTVVDGDPVEMTQGDLILTPNWTYHEHANHGDAPMMWLDVLDLPIVAALEAVFYESGPAPSAGPPLDRSRSELLYGSPGLLPPGTDRARSHSPLLAYRWRDTDIALHGQLAAGRDYGHIRYSDPTTGRDVLPTMRCEFVRVPANASTPPRRQTGSRVGCVLSGAAEITLDDTTFSLESGDIVAIPSWCAASVRARQSTDIFLVSDAPVLEALNLYREAMHWGANP